LVAHVTSLDLMTVLKTWNNIVILHNNNKKQQQKIHSKEQKKKLERKNNCDKIKAIKKNTNCRILLEDIDFHYFSPLVAWILKDSWSTPSDSMHANL